MNFTQYTSNQISLSSLPIRIWNYYLEYLWYHEQDSWVARIAYTCRVLAVLISLPVIIFTLLDVSSYILARTLGVIDDVKASTSDKETVHEDKEVPSIHVESVEMPYEDSSFSESDHGSSVDHHCAQRRSHNSSPPTTDEDGVPPSQFYAGGDDHNNLELSGVGVFSPAASRPSSPVTGRKQMPLDGKEFRHRVLPHLQKDV